MKINSVQTYQPQPNFKGFLNFGNKSLVNTKHIVEIIAPDPYLPYRIDKFISSAGLVHVIEYFNKPKKSFMDLVMEAEKNNSTVYINGYIRDRHLLK